MVINSNFIVAARSMGLSKSLRDRPAGGLSAISIHDYYKQEMPFLPVSSEFFAVLAV